MYMYTIVIHLHTQKQAPPLLASPELKWKNTCRKTENREDGITEKERRKSSTKNKNNRIKKSKKSKKKKEEKHEK